MPDIELDPQADDQRLLSRVLDFYHRTLKDSPDALDYLRKRGITNGEAIDQFRIDGPGRPRDYSLGLPQIRACTLNAPGSSRCGTSLSLTRPGRFAVTRW